MASKNVVQAYSLIAERCKFMLNSKFIMSTNCISSILKTIASVPCLTNFLVKCSQDFSFDNSFRKATATSNFVLPDSSKEVVAFVTQLLYKFDRKEIDITKFIKVYYPSSDFETSYKNFCSDIITRYLMSFNTIVREEDAPALNATLSSNPNEAAKSQVVEYIIALTESVTNDESLSDEKKEEYLLMLDGFYYSFEINRAKMIKVVWTGLKNIMGSYKKASSYLMAIEKILLTYAVI